MERKRLMQDKPGSYFLFGPRGTGKTTWLREKFPNARTITLLSPDVRRELRAYPERLENYLAGTAPGETVVIDEIQRVPALLDTIHKMMDDRRRIRFIMTGSSARKLKRNAQADLLGGRAARRMCHPFVAAEMGEDFRLDEALKYGMIPLVRYPETGSPDEILRTYLDLYLEQEIATEGVVRNLDTFARFLQVASFFHASVLSVSAIARESGVKRSTIDTYFAILEDMLVTARLPVFTRRAKRQLIGHDKFYFFDCGVFRSLRPKGPLDNPNEIDGACLEGLVFQHLRAWNDYRGGPSKLYFWRTKGGLEVDFVEYGEDVFRAIEVKNSVHAERRDAVALEAFHDDYPEAETFLLYRGPRRVRLTEHVDAVPVEDFLLQVHGAARPAVGPYR